MKKETFGERLTRLRKAKGLTQEDIASRVTISPQAVSKWENDISSPDINTLLTLSELLDVSLDELLGKESKEEVKEENKEETKETSKEDVKAEEEAETVEAEVVDDDDDDDDDEDDEDDDDDDEDDTVTINNDGIHVKNKNKEVHIDKNGITVNGEKKQFGPGKIEKETWALSGILLGVALIAYVILGVLWTDQNMGWKSMWIVIFIPFIVSSFVNAIRKKRFCDFLYPFLVTFTYLLLGFLGSYLNFRSWDLYWFLFITIPAYYMIFGEIDRHIKR